MKKPDPLRLIVALIEQVRHATPEGGNETDVITLITRPMWREWLKAVGHKDLDAEPTGWSGMNTLRVFGSQTIVVESEVCACASFARGTEVFN